MVLVVVVEMKTIKQVKVASNLKDRGYWYINLDRKVALFRSDNQFTGNILTDLEDFTTKYKNIKEYLTNELNLKTIRLITKRNKYQISDKVLCSFFQEGSQHTKVCDKDAKLYRHSDNQPVCLEHSKLIK